MRKSLIALVAASCIGMAAVTTPTTAEARYWRGWGWGLGGFALGAVVGSALARPYYGYPYGYGYSYYGYPASYGYAAYPAYSYYSYPAYSYGYAYPSYSYYYGPRYRYGRRHAYARYR